MNANGSANPALADDRAHLAPRQHAVGADVVDARDVVVDRVHQRVDDVVFVDELQPGIEAEDLGHDRAAERGRERRVDVDTQHVGEAQQADVDVRVVVGEVADERLDLEQRSLDRRGRGPGARHVFAEAVRVGLARAVDETRALQHDLAHRTPGRARGREQVHRADHVDLVQRATRRARGVDDEVRVHDRVDLRGAHDAGEDRVRRVGAHELGAFERCARIARVDADDDFDVGSLFERLREASAPVRRQSGDERAHAVPAYPNHTLRRLRSMS